MEEAFERARAVSHRQQGDVLALPDACVVLADAAWPLTAGARNAAGALGTSDGLVVVPHAVDLVVMLTQTCDLQRTDAERYLCQVAPIMDADEAFVRQVARGHRPGWVALPWHGERSVADLARITTIERSLVVGAACATGPSTPAERLHFAESLSRHLTRAAFPDPVSRVLGPVLARMGDRHDRESPEGRCISRVASLRLEATPDLDASQPDLRVLVVLDATDLPTLPSGIEVRDDEIDRLHNAGIPTAAQMALVSSEARACREGWQALAELWVDPAVAAAAATGSGVGDVEVEVLNGDELSFARSRRAPELDLAYLTTRAA